MSDTIIRVLILIGYTAGIISYNLWMCKKLVWLDYDLARNEDYHTPPPMNKDWSDKVYDYGGPLNVLPLVNLILAIVITVNYIMKKCDYNETYHKEDLWENQPLKR